MGSRILIVEDDARIRLSLQLVLEDEGHTVELAESAEAGIEALSLRPAGAVLVDLMLPGMDGFELCPRLRSSSDVPILILTARSDSHDVVAGLEAGADDYMVNRPSPSNCRPASALCSAGPPDRIGPRPPRLR